MRDVRLDQLKTVSAFGIVVIHGFYQAHFFDLVPAFSLSCLLGLPIYTLLFSMTNLFVIISSWFLADGHFRPKKALGLGLTVSAYSLGIFLLTLLFDNGAFSLPMLAECVLSPLVNQYWFVSTYIILYLLSPFLNKGLAALPQKELGKLCLILLAVVSVLPTLLLFVPVQSLFDGKSGKGILWFVTLYILVFYLKHYGHRILAMRKRYLFAAGTGSLLVLTGSRYFLGWLSHRLGMLGDGSTRLYFDSSLFVAILSFSLFLLCLKRKKPALSQKQLRFWFRLSGASLGVYLIHEHPIVKAHLWQQVQQWMERRPNWALPILLGTTIAVFCICLCFEVFRQACMRKRNT